MSPPDVLYAERALAVEPREPPPVGVTRGYCRTFRAGGGNRKACGGYRVDHSPIKKEAVLAGRVIGMASGSADSMPHSPYLWLAS